jgi:hypothetical protein
MSSCKVVAAITCVLAGWPMSGLAQKPVPVPLTSNALRLDVDASALGGIPLRVVSARGGEILVLEEGRLPSIFSTRGNFVGTLGKQGKGPGELTFPTWIDTELDDSVRVLDVDRMVVFDERLRPAHTIVGPRGQLIWHAAFLRRNAFASQSSVQDSRDLTRPVPIVVRSDSGRVLSTIEVPKIDGQKTFISLARALDDPRGFWLAEWTTDRQKGYRLALLDETGRRLRSLVLSRDWWVNSDFKANPAAAITKVRAIRQIDVRTIVVIIAHPRPGWEQMPVDPRTMAGDYGRYLTVVEIVDARTGKLERSETLAGYPISIVDHARIALYLESDDGTPAVSLERIRRE